MSVPILAAKLYIIAPRPGIVVRQHLTNRLNEGLAKGGKLTLVSAPAGFGKTTLVSEWIAQCGRPVAWLSLDEGDSELTRFLSYLIAALQAIKAGLGESLLTTLQSHQLPPTETILTTLLNEMVAITHGFILVLDDYHLIDSRQVDEALAFFVERLPPQMHMIIATREDPHLPLARSRARGQLTELRAADLRFNPAEAADFLNRVMSLNLSAEDVSALEARTEGWIAGLQMAALSMQGRSDTSSFIQSFTGSHRFILDYLIEEVLSRQPENIQSFLLRTSILDSMCGPLCDAILLDPSAGGQETLEYLEHANLFIVPLDNERRWYRYHHLFADLLRQRLQRYKSSSTEREKLGVNELHKRASQWYEDSALVIEAFHHAIAANDIERAERLIKGGAIPWHSRAAVTTVLDWLDLLPKSVLDASPWLWVRSAMLALNAGQTTGVEEKLQEAEAALAVALQNDDPDDETRDLIGQIAAVRATLALARYQPETMILQSHRALQYLHPDNMPFRSRALRTFGFAYQIQGDRAAARQFYTEAIALRQTSGNIHLTVSAITGLGNIQESDNQLHQAAETYRHSLQLLSDEQPPNADQEYIGLARIYYEWNDLDTAEQYAQQSLELARQYDSTVDRFVICEMFLARLKYARGDVAGAADMLEKAEQTVRQQNFIQRMPDIAAAQVLVLLRQGNLAAAAQLARRYELPLSQARVLIAQEDPIAALSILKPYRQQMEVKGWQDERLKAIVLQAVAHHAHGEKDQAVQALNDALALAEPGGFIRIFIDEEIPMAQLLCEAATLGILPDYVRKLLAVFEAEKQKSESRPDLSPARHLIDPLSERELEVLNLLRSELSGPEIAQRLIVSLNTLRSHTKNIFNKLGVNNRRAAIRRAEELDLF